MAIVEIRPLDIPKWHGKKGEESFTQPHTIECLYDPMTGGYATGLTEGEEKKYAKKLGVDLSSVFNQDEPHPFWNSKMGRVALENATMIFDDTRSLDFVKVKMLKASKYVANSIKEWEEGMFPEATHVIFDESEEENIKATKALKKQKAMKLSLDLSADDKANIVQILTGKTVRGRSSNYLVGEIDDLMEDRLDDFIREASKDKKDLHIRGSVLEAIHRNILTKEGSSILYLSDKIGFDFESAVEWFKDPQNQNLKSSILEKLNK
jgi:hypothetical protein